ncbi:MAG: hypothetical protein IJH76_03180 [Clostridia bacterium]|nr:hypothetical protein [Clostridia bacterium]
MKKMIVTIIILLIIFISMVVYKNSLAKAEVTLEEINQIEEYMDKIYSYKEITGIALPEFDNPQNADEKWIWGIVRKNIDDYEIDKSKVQGTINDLFGNTLNKEFPNDGTEFITYNEEKQIYITKELQIDAIKDSFYIKKIEKNDNEYSVHIVEYLVDYTDESGNKAIIKNLSDETIKELSQKQATEENITKAVKENMSKFNKKEVTLEKQGENIVIKKVEKE